MSKLTASVAIALLCCVVAVAAVQEQRRAVLGAEAGLADSAWLSRLQSQLEAESAAAATTAAEESAQAMVDPTDDPAYHKQYEEYSKHVEQNQKQQISLNQNANTRIAQLHEEASKT